MKFSMKKWIFHFRFREIRFLTLSMLTHESEVFVKFSSWFHFIPQIFWNFVAAITFKLQQSQWPTNKSII